MTIIFGAQEQYAKEGLRVDQKSKAEDNGFRSKKYVEPG
jgi:hypothetical protein